MKVTDVVFNEELPDDFEEIICCYQDKKKKDRMAIQIAETDATSIILAVSRINRMVAKAANIDYPAFLEIMKRSAFLDERYGNLNLSAEKLEELVGKDLRGFTL